MSAASGCSSRSTINKSPTHYSRRLLIGFVDSVGTRSWGRSITRRIIVCGLLIDGFQFPPMLLTPHNSPYYSKLIEGWGFEKAMDLYAWWFANPAEAAHRLRRLAVATEKAPRRSRYGTEI